MRTVLYFTVFIGLVMSGCTIKTKGVISPAKGNADIGVIDIDKAHETEKMFFSTYFEPPVIIALETSEQCIIQNIQAIELYENGIYILDDESNALYVFNKDGSFARTIGKYGRGHGEYLELSDFSLDRDNGIIYLWDEALDAAHKYDIDTGDYISSIHTERNGERSFCLQYLNNRLYVNRTAVRDDCEQFLLKEIDATSGEQKAVYLDAEHYNKGWNYPLRLPHTFFYSKNHAEPKYVELFSDTIVSITEGGIMPSYVIKSKDFVSLEDVRQIKEDMASPLDYDLSSFYRKGRISHISRFTEWKHFVYLQYTKGDQAYNLVYDNRDNGVTISTSFINDYISKDLNVPMNVCFSDNEGVLAFIAPFHMAYFVKHFVEDRCCVLELEQDSQLFQLKENANPVLFYHRFKE